MLNFLIGLTLLRPTIYFNLMMMLQSLKKKKMQLVQCVFTVKWAGCAVKGYKHHNNSRMKGWKLWTTWVRLALKFEIAMFHPLSYHHFKGPRSLDSPENNLFVFICLRKGEHRVTVTGKLVNVWRGTWRSQIDCISCHCAVCAEWLG